jgi:hypothetical protein
MTRVAAILVAFVVLLFASRAAAHKPSDSYLTLEIEGGSVQGRWDIAIRDLDYALSLDADGDGKITWGELHGQEAAIVSYAAARLSLQDEDLAFCPMTFDSKAFAVASHSDGTYAVLRFRARCAGSTKRFGVGYRLFFDLDPQHRGIVRIDAAGTTRTQTIGSTDGAQIFVLAEAGRAQQLRSIVKQGIVHIWMGYDHVLFLLALLLPSVLRREGTVWRVAPTLRPAVIDVLRIVTAFTIAHSITLSLAALGVMTLPSRLVESAIAASVVLAAANNLYPLLRQDRWMAAFVLGLLHGFGFSSTLMDLDLPRSNLVLTLFGFNAGVEIGQVAIVALFVPVAFGLRRTTAYRRVALVGGSIVIALLATIWLVERAFVIKIIS